MDQPHQFTGTYDGWAGECLLCGVGPHEVISDLTAAARLAIESLDAIPSKRLSQIARLRRMLEASVANATCKGAAATCEGEI